MSVIEYGNLKYEVSEGIDWKEEGDHLISICRTFLPDGSKGRIQDVLSLLEMLEEKKHLAIDSLAVLKELLKQLDEWNLFEKVEKFENKRKEYKRFLEQCAGVLDKCGQLERLISVCEGKISHERRRHITDVSKLFTELEKQNNLGIERLEILKTMATEMEKPDLLQQVEEFDKKRKEEEDADRKRRNRQVQTAAVLASARYAGGRLIGIVTPQCTFRNVAGGIVVVTTWMILRRSSSLQEFVHTFTEAVLPLGNSLRAISEGSLCFTVQAQTTSALEALWKTYQDETLQRNLQEFLVTEEIKQVVGSEVSLTVKIDEQEYKDAVCDLEAEMEEKEEWKGFEDQSSSDPVQARVREAHPDVRNRIAFVKEYLANLQETYSVTTETTDSGLWSQSAPSEFGLYDDTGDIQGILERIDEGMKEIIKKLDILTELGGVATRDEDILDNIQQVRKEMENIRKTLEMLGKPVEKTKYAARRELKHSLRSMIPTGDDEAITPRRGPKTSLRSMIPTGNEAMPPRRGPKTSLPSRHRTADEGSPMRRSESEPLPSPPPSPPRSPPPPLPRREPKTSPRSRKPTGDDEVSKSYLRLGDDEEWVELPEKELARDSSPSDPKPSSVGGGLAATEPTTSLPSTEPVHDDEEPTTSQPSREPIDDDKVEKVEVEPKQQKQKEGSKVEFK